MNGWVWTEEVTAEAARLCEQGRSATEIAKAIGAPSRNAVIGRLHRVGHRLKSTTGGVRLVRPWTEANLKELEAMYARGHTIKECAQRLGRTPGSVQHKIHVLGLKRRVPATRLPQPMKLPPEVKANPWSAIETANDNAIPLMSRKRLQCAWPVGEPERPADQMCCGQPVAEDAPKPYCQAHRSLSMGRVVSVSELQRQCRRYA